jgi:formate dehydrogenase
VRRSGGPGQDDPDATGDTVSISTFCRICEPCCGLIAEVTGDRLVRLRGNPDHALSLGFACNKPQGLLELTYAPERLTTPMVRSTESDGFVSVSWDEALACCAEGLAGVRSAYGESSVAVLRGNPPYFDSGAALWGEGFERALGITRTYSVNAEDGAARLAANEALYGDQYCFGRPDLWNTDLAIIMGANPLQARSTRLSEPRIREALDSILDRGGRVVVVDPVRTATAKRYQHISIRPGADPWFLIALCVVLGERSDIEARAQRAAPLSGLGDFLDLTGSFHLEVCADRCGVPTDTIRDLADNLLAADSATVYGGTGTCAQRFGTLTNILMETVLALTGNIDRVGGLLGSWTPLAMDAGTSKAVIGAHPSRVEGRPDVAGALPSAALAPDILEPGQGQVRGLLIHGSNAVLSSAGGGTRLESALADLEFCVALDIFVNETNRYADVLLPVTTMFERDDYPLATAGTQLRPVAYASRAVIAPVGEARDAWWVLDEISRRMGLGGSCPDKELEAAADARGTRVTPVDVIDQLLAHGPEPSLSCERLVTQHPNGIPLRASLPVGRLSQVLQTEDHRVQLFSSTLRSEIERLVVHEDPDDVWPLRLVGRRERGSQNTWMHNSRRIYPEDYQFRAHVHPEDAAARGIRNGDRVKLSSAVGSLIVPVSLVETVGRGVVSVPHGWGHSPGTWRATSLWGGANSNDLADPDDVEAIAGMAILNGIAIQMEPANDGTP